MLFAAIGVSTLPDTLALLGSAGSVVGGGVGLAVEHSTLRQALENIALGAAVGGGCGCFATFLAYIATQMIA
jgi:hypothetical protein